MTMMMSTDGKNYDESTAEDEKLIGKYINQLKSKFSTFVENIKKENVQTKEAYKLLVNSIKSSEKLTKQEKEQIGNQLKDVLKLAGFTAASILPGGFVYLLLTRITFMKKHMIPSSFLQESSIMPSSGTGARAGGGFPFGHEFGSAASQAGVELNHAKRDKAEKTIEDESKGKEKKKVKGKAKSFEEFISRAGQLTEMEGGAASPASTPGMGNVVPGGPDGVGSGDKFGDDDDDDDDKKNSKRSKRAKNQDDWRKWKKKSKSKQKGQKSDKGVQTQMAAWELGGKLPVPVANTVR